LPVVSQWALSYYCEIVKMYLFKIPHWQNSIFNDNSTPLKIDW